MFTHTLLIGGLAALAPPSSPQAAGTAAAAPAQVAPANAEPGNSRRRKVARRTKRRAEASSPHGGKPPWSWPVVGAHYGTGVLASLLVLPGSYALASYVGHQGKGLGPVVGSMLIGAFLPSPIIYTTQWAVTQRLAPRRHRFWPGLLVHQAGHLAVFAGAVLGGASFRDFRDAAPVVLADAFVVTALSSLTSEATRRPVPLEIPELSWERHTRLWRPQGFTVVVPLVKLRF
jgi:hypothetical protein